MKTGPLTKPVSSPKTVSEWRLRKEMKRQKQRIANVARARKMHDLRMALGPPVDGAKTVVATPAPAVNIGCSGWFYWHWRRTFYPATIKTSQWFAYYSARFRTVELNAPFYSWPTVATVKSWLRQIGRKKFVYTVKVCELITHVKRFRHAQGLIQDFYTIERLLGKHMGCFLFQLPPSFRFTTLRLKTILAQLDHSRRNVVEFRHSSWWNAKVFDAFRKTGTIFCSCSAPRLPDDLVKTADDIYVRFHGKARWYRHDYTRAELKTWVGKIEASGARSVWAYFNNDREGYALKNARQLVSLLKRVGG